MRVRSPGPEGPTPVGTYRASLAAAALGSVSRTAITQLRLRFTLDDNNDHGADYISFWSGNAGTASNRPLLWVYVNP